MEKGILIVFTDEDGCTIVAVVATDSDPVEVVQPASSDGDESLLAHIAHDCVE